MSVRLSGWGGDLQGNPEGKAAPGASEDLNQVTNLHWRRDSCARFCSCAGGAQWPESDIATDCHRGRGTFSHRP